MSFPSNRNEGRLRKSQGPVSDVAGFSTREKDGSRWFVFSGSLTAHSLHMVETALQQAVSRASASVVMDLSGLDSLDTNGALLVNQAAAALEGRGLACSMRTANELQRKLLEKSRIPAIPTGERQKFPVFLIWCNYAGRTVLEGISLIGQLIGFLGKFLSTLRRLVHRPGRMRWTSLVFHMEHAGLRAVPIVALLTFLIGMVVAYMGAGQLQRFGAQIFAVNLLEVTVLREMAVLITSIVVAGRSSSSFTAQIGAMAANEEVDAMRSMGLDPEELLVAPRVLALILCLPMLVFIADIMALLGGAAAIWYTMDMSFSSFITQFQDVADINNFFVGLVKTPFFALAIALIGCFHGFRATASAESVGLLTTVSVVQAIFAVILLDALFAIFFTTLGI